jgi:chorismate mutase
MERESGPPFAAMAWLLARQCLRLQAERQRLAQMVACMQPDQAIKAWDRDRETARMLVAREYCATLDDHERDDLIEAIAVALTAEREACAQLCQDYADEVERDPQASRAVPTDRGLGHVAANILVRAVIKIRDRAHVAKEQV